MLGNTLAIALPLLCGTAIALATSADAGLDPSKSITQFQQDVWGTEEGLPQNDVPALAQSRDGYLWLGTELGLVRFDGLHFTVFDKSNTPELRSNKVDALLVDRAGDLWIGTVGGGLTRYSAGKFQTFTNKNGLSSDSVLSLFEDRAGNLWVGTDGGGLDCFRDGRVTAAYTTRNGLSNNEVFALAEDRAGNLWIGTHDGLTRFSKGEFHNYGLAEGLSSASIHCLYVARDGTLWIGTVGGGLLQLKNENFQTMTTRDGLPSNVIDSVHEDSRGTLWIGTGGGGLARLIRGTLTVYGEKEGLPNDTVWSLLEDRTGSLWMGTGGAGVARLSEGNLFTSYGTREGLSRPVTLPIFEDHAGNLWIGTDGGLNRFRDGKFSVLTTRHGLASDFIFSISETADQSLWVGTRKGLNRLKDGRIETYTKANGLPGDSVLVTYAGYDGTLWIGTRAGLGAWKNGKITTYTTEDGLSSNIVRSLYEDAQHTLWIGTAGGGLNVLRHGRFEVLDSHRGLSNDVVISIHQDGDGVLWIGTDGGGLNRLKDGTFHAITTKDGLTDDAIFRILEDDSRNLWMSSNKGVFRIAIQALNDFADNKTSRISPITYGVPDGMKTRECNGGFQPAGWKARDGTLWFPTMKGITMVDPRKVARRSPPLIAVLERTLIDGRVVNPDENTQVPPGRGELQFRYTAPELRFAHRVVFRYKLDGFDRDWVEACSRRTAFYTNIPPGQYRFEVMASNGDGEWNSPASFMDFSLKPHFFQTRWFYLLCALAFIAVIIGGHLTHVRQLRERERSLEARVGQRTAELRKEIADREKAELELLKAKDAAERASRVKSEFLANMSHEIRTPMNGILGMTELALSSGLNSEQQSCLEIVKHSADSLLTVINDILDFSKVEAGKLELDPIDFNLRQLVDETIKAVGFRADEKHLRFVWSVDPEVPDVVNADPVRLRQILLNLLSNAIKFTEHGEVVLQVMRETLEGARASLHFVVRDTGIGIPQEKLGSIFDAFSQADGSTTRRFGGTGLGLAICERLVHLMGGRVWVKSEVGRGSEFHFSAAFGVAPVQNRALRMETNSVAAPHAFPPHTNGDTHKVNVLLAEDNPANRMVARLTLERAGFQVHEVENGRDAVEAVRRRRFDIVLMDCRMPVMDGYGASRAIRQLPGAASDVPIIALTANAFKEDRERSAQAGMDDFVSKPFQARELVSKCLAWVRAGQVVAQSPSADRILDGDDFDKYPAEFLKGLMETFVETAPPVFERLVNALRTANWLQARESAHWLRGGASRMLNPTLQQQLEQLEHTCVSASPSISSAEIENVQLSFEAALRSAESRLLDQHSWSATA